MSIRPAAASDGELLAAARGGDADATEALLERHQARVYRFGMKMCRDPEDAKDVLQDTLLAAARGLPTFRGEASLPTWLFTIARSYCIKRRRKGAQLRAFEGEAQGEAASTSDAAPAPDEALARKEVAEVVDEAISALEPMYREVLVLRDVEGLPASEVAEVLGIGVDAVKSRLHRARLAVRARVAPRLGRTSEEPPVLGADRAPAKCPDVLELYSRHLEGEIDAELCAQMEQHLSQCARCRGRCDSLKQTLAQCRTAPAAQVPVAVRESIRQAVRRALGQRA